ncbi:hypothetical protein L204_100021 [Cryptococcus depauperatus]
MTKAEGSKGKEKEIAVSFDVKPSFSNTNQTSQQTEPLNVMLSTSIDQSNEPYYSWKFSEPDSEIINKLPKGDQGRYRSCLETFKSFMDAAVKYRRQIKDYPPSDLKYSDFCDAEKKSWASFGHEMVKLQKRKRLENNWPVTLQCGSVGCTHKALLDDVSLREGWQEDWSVPVPSRRGTVLPKRENEGTFDERTRDVSTQYPPSKLSLLLWLAVMGDVRDDIKNISTQPDDQRQRPDYVGSFVPPRLGAPLQNNYGLLDTCILDGMSLREIFRALSSRPSLTDLIPTRYRNTNRRDANEGLHEDGIELSPLETGIIGIESPPPTRAPTRVGSWWSYRRGMPPAYDERDLETGMRMAAIADQNVGPLQRMLSSVRMR